MTDICIMRYQCKVCNAYFSSYTECEIIKHWDKVLQVMRYTINTEYGNFLEHEVYQYEDGMTVIDNTPIENKRKCYQCRTQSKITTFID